MIQLIRKMAAMLLCLSAASFASTNSKSESAPESIIMAMNTNSPEARQRSELFESISKRHGFIILNGRWGGEFNNDQLALQEQDGKTILLLGLKVTSPSGDLQLDQMSLGPFVQLSPLWISAVIQCLKLDKEQADISSKIERAQKSNTLLPTLLIYDKSSNDVKFLRVKVPE